MKKIRVGLWVAAALWVNGGAQAQSTALVQGLRFDVSYSLLNVKNSTSSYDPVGIRVGIAKPLWGAVEAEGLLGMGVQSGKNNLNPALTTEVGSIVGAFIKPSMALGPAVSGFARVGLASTQIKNGDTHTGLSSGLGLNYALDAHMRIYADYTVYKFSDNLGISAVNLGVNYGF
ncbi:MAG: autotransporter outer membrane beta-barrel domain-containing protein [Betaproteobacteria bacterium]|nr:autotransporter outer membrane beta-barrel domain-containing protein [Betaproteobacteria bacterium]NBY05376.1 autotransporter outer membrane beta-barrel domain-containing protein [Betaproteobacteria bacterium]